MDTASLAIGSAALLVAVISLGLVVLIWRRQDALITSTANLDFREKMNVVEIDFRNVKVQYDENKAEYAALLLGILVRNFEAAWEVRRHVNRALLEEMTTIVIRGIEVLQPHFHRLTNWEKGLVGRLLDRALDFGVSIETLTNWKRGL